MYVYTYDHTQKYLISFFLNNCWNDINVIHLISNGNIHNIRMCVTYIYSLLRMKCDQFQYFVISCNKDEEIFLSVNDLACIYHIRKRKHVKHLYSIVTVKLSRKHRCTLSYRSQICHIYGWSCWLGNQVRTNMITQCGIKSRLCLVPLYTKCWRLTCLSSANLFLSR